MITPEQRQAVAEQSVEVTALAKAMCPTRNGRVTAEEFMNAVRDMFHTRGWDFSMFCFIGTQNFMARQRTS